MGIQDHIIVNDFMFCQDHGKEWCAICCCDHRMCNNIQIEDQLDLDDNIDVEVIADAV